MSLSELLLLAVAAAAVWLAWSSLKAREAANAAIRDVCARNALLFLDDTVALASLAPVRSADGRLTLRRIYAFDYSDTGDNRRSGTVTVVGNEVTGVAVGVGVPPGQALH
jgi:hypothetical protein